jgi:hypothetical protein
MTALVTFFVRVCADLPLWMKSVGEVAVFTKNDKLVLMTVVLTNHLRREGKLQIFVSLILCVRRKI